MDPIGLTAIGIIVLTVVWAVLVYNGLITKRNRVREAFSQTIPTSIFANAFNFEEEEYFKAVEEEKADIQVKF